MITLRAKICGALGAMVGAGLCAVGIAAEGGAVAGPPPNPRYTGSWAIREWTTEETGGAPQSFDVTQDPASGLIYVANEKGVLEYDGARWRRLPLPENFSGDQLPVWSVVQDERGRIWAGSNNELIRYAADALGAWRGERLQLSWPEIERGFGVIWQLRWVAGSIWGLTANRIIRVGGDGLRVKSWPMPGGMSILGVVDGEVWFRRNGNELICVHDGAVGAAPVPALPKGLYATGAVRTASGAIQVEHSRGVLALVEGGWVPWSPELSSVLTGNDQVTQPVQRADGTRVFSTRSRTLVLVDATGRVLGRFNEPPGVTFGVTPRTFLDREGGLWMANASGIRRVEISSPVARHARTEGLRGGVRDLAWAGTTLWAATSQGLFARDESTGSFAFQSGSLSDEHALAPSPTGGWLVAAGQRFGEWRDKSSVNAMGGPQTGVALASDPLDPARVFVGGMEVGVYRRRADRWEKEAGRSVGTDIYYVAADENGWLWMTSGILNGLWRAGAPGGDWSKATVERVDGQKDRDTRPPAALWKVTTVESEAVIYGTKGIWRAETPGGRVVPDQRFAGLPAGAMTPIECVASGARRGTINLAGAGEQEGRYWRGVRENRNEAWKFQELSLPELKSQITGLERMVESPDGKTLWLGAVEGAFSIDLTAAPSEFMTPAARWRGAWALEGGEVFDGGAGPRATVALGPGRRAVRVEFSAPVMRLHAGGRAGIEFRTRAAGVDHDWTVWSAAEARELTNLPPGPVRLEVEARNHLGAIGPAAAMTLLVPPFWWETWWWRSFGVLAAAGLVAAAVWWFVHRQFRQRIALLEAQAAVQNERLRIARDMHDDLGSTLASIVHLSGDAPGAGAQPDATLARIHEATRDLVHRTRDIVWAATPQHDSLESLIEQLAAHAERTLGDRGIEVRAELPAEVPDEPIAGAARHDLFLAFKEAVNNAAKYAQARTAIVRAELTADALVVTLRDDGVGFAAGARRGTGNGLGNLRARLAALGGSAEIASVVGQGTTVTLRLPRKRKGGRA